MPVTDRVSNWSLVSRMGIQCAGLSLLLIPAAILAFADELQIFVMGTAVHFGAIGDPFFNGIVYLSVTAALAAAARMVILLFSIVHHPRPQLTIRGDPFASWPVLLMMSGSVAALLVALVFGHIGIGLQQPAVQVLNEEAIHRQAAELMGESLPNDEPLQAFFMSGFAVTTYEIRTIPRPATTASSRWEWKSITYEEYGFPLRCLRTPIDIGVPRPGLRRLFFDSYEDHFIWKQLTNIRLLAGSFALNAAVFASALWLFCIGPVFIHRTMKQRNRLRQGRCLKCGYILHTRPRCPECGTVSSSKAVGHQPSAVA